MNATRAKPTPAELTGTLTAVRAGFGLAQLSGPWPTAQESAGRRIAQVLGVRHLVQAALSGPAPTIPVLALGVEVDLLHAATMVGLALTRPSARRPALAQAVVALGFAAVGAAAARQAATTPAWARTQHSRISPLRARDEWSRTLAQRLVPARFTAALTDRATA
ncbi:MAG TPA: hypothetical protein VGX23_00490 [Actinocrinis sp.]|nr:hypothetical protein [Actinocrinis sp.]